MVDSLTDDAYDDIFSYICVRGKGGGGGGVLTLNIPTHHFTLDSRGTEASSDLTPLKIMVHVCSFIANFSLK